MANETTYSVNVKYLVSNQGGRRATSELNDDVRKLDANTRSARDSFGLLGAAAAVAFGFAIHRASDAMIGFNSTVQDTKLQIAGMLALTKKTDLADQVDRADRIFGNLQKRAASLPGTTMEYARMAGMLTLPITDAGLGMKDLEDLTVNAVVGAKALGLGWQESARDIDQALRGTFHATDIFTGKILGAAGYKGDKGREKFNALSAEQRAAELRAALTTPQLTQLAAAQGASFGGMMSTIQDTLQQTMGQVGLPLFKTITNELKTWNQWLETNALTVRKIATSMGEGIASGFGVMKDALLLLIEHRDSIMALGKIWLAVKIGGLIGGRTGETGSGAVGGISSAMAWGRGPRDRYDEEGNYVYEKAGAGRQAVSWKSAAANAGLIAQAGAVGYALGSLLSDVTGLKDALHDMAIGETGREFERVRRASDSLTEAMERAALAAPNQAAVQTNLSAAIGRYHTLASIASDAASAPMRRDREGNEFVGELTLSKIKELDALGVGMKEITKAGGLKAFADASHAMEEQLTARRGSVSQTGDDAFEMGMVALTDYQRQTLDVQRAQQDLLTYINRSLSSGIAISPQTVIDILRKDTEDPEGKHKSNLANKPNVNIHIARIEVQSDDPDRMAFGLVEFFRDAAKNPSSAVNALREG